MRILIISTYFPPLNSIASLRPYSWAKCWSKEGHDVTVLTTKKIPDPSVDFNLSFDKFEVIEASLSSFIERIKRKRKGTSQSPGKTDGKNEKASVMPWLNSFRMQTGILTSCRFPDLTQFWIKHALKAVKDHEPWDLIVSCSGPYTVHVVAEKLKKLGKAKKWVADYRDKWSDNHIYPGLFPLNRFEQYWERKLMKSADAIVTVSDPYAESFRMKYGNDKVFVVENGFDPADLGAIPSIPIFLEDNKFRIVHTGSVYPQNQRPEILFDSIRQLNRDPSATELLKKLEVIFVGPNLSPVERMITEYDVSAWVKVLGLVNREVALRMQRDAHAVLFFPWVDHGNNGIFSGKIFEYLYSRTPVMAISVDSQNFTSQFIEDSEIGMTLTSAEQIIDYLKDHLQEVKKKKMAPSQEILNRYDRKNLAMKLLDISQGV